MSGRFNVVKEQFKTLIGNAIPEGYVSGNWFIDIREIVRNLPCITVRISPIRDWDTYDRAIGQPTSGSMSDFNFSIHVFHSNCRNGCEKGKFAQDVADRIKDVLLPLSSPPSYWWDVSEVNTRESEPARGGKRISRVIIEGVIHVQRID